MKAETDGQSIIHRCHGFLVQLSHSLPQTGLIQGPNLLQQDDAVSVQSHTLGG